MKLTKEQYEKLKPYEKDIKAAYKNSFLHMPGSDFIKVAAIYTEITGKALTKSQMSCNTCRLNTLRKLGELYVQYTESLERKEQLKKEEEPKKRRPKKLTEENVNGKQL